MSTFFLHYSTFHLFCSLSSPLHLHALFFPQDVVLANPKNERALGQLLVLVQYQWPLQEEMLANIITTIQKRRKFIFPEFFSYVISIFDTQFYQLNNNKKTTTIETNISSNGFGNRGKARTRLLKCLVL